MAALAGPKTGWSSPLFLLVVYHIAATQRAGGSENLRRVLTPATDERFRNCWLFARHTDAFAVYDDKC